MFGGPDVDSGKNVYQTIDGGYIVVGETKSYGAGDTDGWIVKFSAFENQQPNRPSRPSGPSSGKVNEEHTYTTLTTDPDGNQIYYMFDWGDYTNSGWLGPFGSGEECSASHIWFEQGSYQVRVKAQDSNGAESDWSDPLPVSMPKTYENPLRILIEKLFNWLAQILERDILLGIFNL